MCDPVTAIAGGVALAGSGAVLQNQAAKSNARSQQRAIDRQTGVSRAEFNRRQGMIGESDSRIDTLTDEGFTESLSLRKESFDGSQAGEQGRFDDLLGIESDYVDGDFAGRSAGNEQLQGIAGERDSETSKSFRKLGQLGDEENERQSGFRQQADDVISGSVVGGNAFDTFDTGQQSEAAAISQLISDNVGNPELPSFLNTLSPETLRTIGAQTSQSAGAVRSDAGAIGEAESFNNALGGLDRSIVRAGEDLGVLDLQSELSRDALGEEVKAARLRGDNARAASGDRRGAVTAEVDSFLNNLRLERDGKLNRTTRFRDGIDAARDSAFTDKASALESFYGRNLQAENSFIGALTDSSQRYEDTTRNLTNFKVANTRTTSPLGSFLSQVGTTAAAAGGSAYFAK